MLPSRGCRGPRVAHLTNGGDDAGVGATATEVATHPLADLVVAARVPLGQTCHARANLSGGAKAALQAVVLEERLLERVEAVAEGEALDGGHLGAVERDGERQTRQDAPALDEHGAGAALAVVAAF